MQESLKKVLQKGNILHNIGAMQYKCIYRGNEIKLKSCKTMRKNLTQYKLCDICSKLCPALLVSIMPLYDNNAVIRQRSKSDNFRHYVKTIYGHHQQSSFVN